MFTKCMGILEKYANVKVRNSFKCKKRFYKVKGVEEMKVPYSLSFGQ